MLSLQVLMLSPTCTDAIPLQYCSYPSAVLSSASIVLMLSPHSTEQPPQYWCYPPQYWTASSVLMLPPQYWTASAVLNRRYTGCWCKMAAKNHEHTYLRLFRSAFSVNPCRVLYTAIVQCQYYFLLFRATYLKHFPKHVLGLRFNMYSWPPDFCISRKFPWSSVCVIFFI